MFLSLSCNVVYSEVIGWVEKVRIYPGNAVLKAKIDTGAKTSSLHVTKIKLIEHNREEWVHFTVTSLNGDVIPFERKIQRVASIKRHFEDTHRRLVVLLGICIGNTYREAEVNLIDRSELNYPMLVGRQHLAGNFIVDSARKFNINPNCKDLPKE